MPEPRRLPGPDDLPGAGGPEALAAAVARAVAEVPGVARLEPTLGAGLRALTRHSPADGVRLVSRAGLVEVDVTLATLSSHQARAVAEEVRGCVQDVVRRHDATPGPVTVSVLSVDVTDGPSTGSGSGVGSGSGG